MRAPGTLLTLQELVQFHVGTGPGTTEGEGWAVSDRANVFSRTFGTQRVRRKVYPPVSFPAGDAGHTGGYGRSVGRSCKRYYKEIQVPVGTLPLTGSVSHPPAERLGRSIPVEE